MGRGSRMPMSEELRVSDGKQNRVVEFLKDQTAQGRLNLEKLEQRTSTAYADQNPPPAPATHPRPAKSAPTSGLISENRSQTSSTSPPARPACSPCLPAAADGRATGDPDPLGVAVARAARHSHHPVCRRLP